MTMALDRFFAERFAEVGDITWADVYAGDAVAIDKAMALARPTGRYRAPSINVGDTEAPGPHGAVPVRVYSAPDAADLPCLVWMHGGAFKWGDLDMLEAHAVAGEIANRLPAVVVSVDYRLSPKFQYPVPVDDCVAVVQWVVADSHAEIGADPNRLAVGGASAGANLATAAALRLRDEHGPGVRALCLAYPAVHREIPTPTAEIMRATQALPPLARFDAASRREIYKDYLGETYDDPTPYGTPAIADLRGLPPVAIANAEHDDLRPSGEDFARRLREAGVVVAEWTELGMAHGYLNYVGDVAGAERTLDRFVDHLRSYVKGSQPN
jgi:acetyl esterase/lipase